MLPKVANHLLHHTTRAVAAVQNQTGHTIRNVLQLQSSSGTTTAGGNLNGRSGPSSSNSGWNGQSSGPGGAKYHAGSRPFSGYSGAGRAVTQAESIIPNDASQCRNDDSAEAPLKTARLRRRSPSFSTHERSGENTGVSRAVQSRAMSRHSFKERSVKEYGGGSSILSSQGVLPSLHVLPSPSVNIRHQSAAAAQPAAGAQDTVVSHPLPLSAAATSFVETSEQRANQIPTPPPEDTAVHPDEEALFASLINARQIRSPTAVLQAVERVRSLDKTPSIAVYNAALEALHEVRLPGQSLRRILETYNEMLARSVLPNFRTYAALINALTDRDVEISKTIKAIKSRIRRRSALDTAEPSVRASDEQLVANLHKENNFRSAMTLFQTVCSIPRTKPDLDMYRILLRACAVNGNVDAAIHIFAHLERRQDLRPTPDIFRHLINVYATSGDLQGAREVFEEFNLACKAGRITSETLPDDKRAKADVVDASGPQSENISVWNVMIEAYIRCGQHTTAIGMLEQMLDSKAGEATSIKDTPFPNAETYHSIIRSFCMVGEVETALSWHNRLLDQDLPPLPRGKPSQSPARPDYGTYTVMLEALAEDGRVDELNVLFSRLVQQGVSDGLHVRDRERRIVLRANLRYLQKHDKLKEARVIPLLDFLVHSALPQDEQQMRHLLGVAVGTNGSSTFGEVLMRQYLKHHHGDKAIELAERFVSAGQASETVSNPRFTDVSNTAQQSARFVQDLAKSIEWVDGAQVSLSQWLRIARLFYRMGEPLPDAIATRFLQAHHSRLGHDELPTSEDYWEVLLYHASRDHRADELSLYSLLLDMGRRAVKFGDISKDVLRRVCRRIYAIHGPESAREFLVGVSPEFRPLLDDPGLQLSAPVKVTESQSISVNSYSSTNTKSVLAALTRFETGQRRGVYPSPEVIARLIGTLGRVGLKEKVPGLYRAAQHVLATLERDKPRQSAAWFQIEDQMVIAMAHEDMDAAHVHRTRIIDQGAVPSADAYGALVHHVRDTTDDSQNAMNMFLESRALGVRPNLYLYNTIISKLAKARKADDALALFNEMKSYGLTPSSVTYGAVIAACCRVGDAASAEVLFEEMTRQSSFKPRIPPYNTMMQLYTHTKPDRPRVLHYYNALLAAGVQPTAHTYKLLMDAYGSIEPIEVKPMEEAFRLVTTGPELLVQGTHWASLINSWGCVQKDLDRALSVFDSIADHPSTQASPIQLPDAVVFEALINVLVTLRRTDLIPVYTERLVSHGVHMTAYIANLIIKGYASVGEMERAREIFESLADPPEGVAAPHNHSPHGNGPSQAVQVPIDVPVFREPSTWEAMVRAELGQGNRDRAIALLERAQARQFPPAVYHRISGIMHTDDSGSQTPSHEVVTEHA